MRASLLTLAFAFVLTTSSASADPLHECIAASEQAQTLKFQHHLLASRRLLLLCARDECPGPVRKDCADLLASVDASIATVVPTAKGSNGEELSQVRVLVDGAVLAESLDGRAVPIDPGPHRFRFEHPGSPPVEEDVIVDEGTRAKAISATLQTPVPKAAGGDAEPVHADERRPTLSYVLLGVGIVGVGVGSYFGVRAIQEDVYSTNAAEDAFHLDQHLSTASFAVGLVALGVGAWLWLSAPAHRSSATAHAAAARSGLSFAW